MVQKINIYFNSANKKTVSIIKNELLALNADILFVDNINNDDKKYLTLIEVEIDGRIFKYYVEKTDRKSWITIITEMLSAKRSQRLFSTFHACMIPDLSCNTCFSKSTNLDRFTDRINHFINEDLKISMLKDLLHLNLTKKEADNIRTIPYENTKTDYKVNEANKSIKDIFVSEFAPAEVKRKSNFMVQLYLHSKEDNTAIEAQAKAADVKAERRDFIPLCMKLNNGDKVEFDLTISCGEVLMNKKKGIIWNGVFTRCSFVYFVPKDLDADNLLCETKVFVNGLPVGEMQFVTQLSDRPVKTQSKINTHRYTKTFLSYAHEDADTVKTVATAYEIQGIDCFYDDKSIKTGDILMDKIYDYIDHADAYILFWSKNSARSSYVQKERTHALSRAYPQTSLEDAKLSIYPISIQPRADLPEDMKNIYRFTII